MSKAPRLLPILAVAVGGVLAIKAASGVGDLPNLMAGARAWAEEAAPAVAGKAAKDKAQSPLPAGASMAPPKPPAPVCAPTAVELAREAGLSPAELQVLQSLGVRRGQLDQREKDMGVQLALMAAAEAKLDAKLKTLSGLKGDIQGLLGQADAQKQAEADRLVKVYEAMKPKDAAARMTVLSDDVRLPIAAKMKDRALSAVLAQMPVAAAKELTEKLSLRMSAADAAKQALAAASAPAASATAAATPAAATTPTAAPAAAAPVAAAVTKPAVKAPAKPRPKPKPKAKAKAKAKPAAKPAAPAAAAAPERTYPKPTAAETTAKPAAAKPAAAAASPKAG
jgi:flagellar motility protein MotE (MotC chaperone)